MRNYNTVINAISKELHEVYQQESWSESRAEQTSYKILTLVEEFQNLRLKSPPTWRASD